MKRKRTHLFKNKNSEFIKRCFCSHVTMLHIRTMKESKPKQRKKKQETKSTSKTNGQLLNFLVILALLSYSTTHNYTAQEKKSAGYVK